MAEKPPIWYVWKRKLNRWGMEDGVAMLLDAAGPLSMLFAQLIYLSQPMLGKLLSPEATNALADLLEEPTHTKAFVDILREAS